MPEGLGGFALTVLVTQVVVIAAPALLMALAADELAAADALLRWPVWWTVPAAGLLAAGVAPIGPRAAIGGRAAVPGERGVPACDGRNQAATGPGRISGRWCC